MRAADLLAPARLTLVCIMLAGCIPIDPLPLTLPDAAAPECLGPEDCALPGAQAACVDGHCAIDTCVTGNSDDDGDPRNGCEACVPFPGPDGCDGVDTDCDGRLDEDGDDTIDACGACDVRCAGAEADYVCVEGGCVVEACSPGRYAVGGVAAGCPCAVDGLAAQILPLEPLARPVAPRLAFPGDGQPGAVVWTETEGDRHRLMRWALTPAGHPVGEPAEIAGLGGPHDVLDAWFTDDGALVALLAEPRNDRFRLTAWRDDAPRVLYDDCDDDHCRAVRLPELGAGLVRKTRENDRVRILGADGEVLHTWNRPQDGALPNVDLLGAICLAEDFCVAAVDRGGIRLVGAIEGELDPVDEVELAVIDGRMWLVGRVDDTLFVAAGTDDMGTDPVALPVEGWRSPRLLPAPEGGAWLVATADDEPVALRIGADLAPQGDPRPLTAGFDPVGLAASGLFFDHSPRAGTVDRLVWSGLADPEPAPGVPPTAVGDLYVYRGATGLFALPVDAGADQPPIVLMRRLGTPDAAPAAAVVDGRGLVVEPVPEGLAVVDLERGERRVMGLRVGGRQALLRADAAVALAPDGRLALVGTLADGRPVFALGGVHDAELELVPTGLAPEADVTIAGGYDAPSWAISRVEPGVGYETLVRRLDAPASPVLLARRFSPRASASTRDGQLLLAWLDRRSDRCGDGSDQVLLTTLAADAPDARAPQRVIPIDGCPRDLALASDGRGVYLLVSVEDGVQLIPLDARGAPQAPPAVAPVDPPERLSAGAGPTALWSSPAALSRLPFECREGEDAR